MRNSISLCCVKAIVDVMRYVLPRLWRSKPDTDSVGVKPAAGELSLASVLTNKAELRLVLCAGQVRHDKSNKCSFPRRMPEPEASHFASTTACHNKLPIPSLQKENTTTVIKVADEQNMEIL